MKRFQVFLSAVLAGVCIGLGGTVFLSLENRIAGAVLFTVGLFVICTTGLHLFTGKVCYVFQRDAAYALDTLRAAGYRAGAIYDNDISGTRAALLSRADFLIASWEDLDPDEFLARLC